MRILRATLVCILSAIVSRADAPLPPPTDVTAYSPNKRFYAFSEVKQRRTQVFASAQKTALWTIPGYHRILFVSNDGVSVVVCQPEGSLILQPTMPQDELLSFYSSGKLVRSLKVGEVFPDLSKLPKTVSHLSWGTCLGFDARNRFVIETFDARRFAFNPATGRRALN